MPKDLQEKQRPAQREWGSWWRQSHSPTKQRPSSEAPSYWTQLVKVSIIPVRIFYQLQYCAKVIRAKYANFVLCLLCELSLKVHPKIQASFHNILRVISLKQRTKIRGIFKTRTAIPYQRDNSSCSMRNIAVQCADQHWAINVSFSCEQSRSRWRFTPL